MDSAVDGLLVHIALGDAYGAGFEYAPERVVRAANDLSGYRQHERHLGIRPGQYTDDTQMSLAVAEALLRHGRPTPRQWADSFVDCFQRDRRDGYAGRFYDFLVKTLDGAAFLERIRPYSDKSGAAMRVLPVACLADPVTVAEVAAEQARLTHDTPGGVTSAQAAALAGHYLRRQLGTLEELPSFLEARLPGPWFGWRGFVGATGLEAVRAALTALLEHRSLSDLLRACVDYTGDVDTVAALALGLASWSPEYSRDLPEPLWRGLENGPFGVDYLREIDTRLATTFP